MIPNDSLIKKYNTTAPRYTSYPPANFFVPVSHNDYRTALIRSNSEQNNAISIYIHIPFCKQLCWYCGCNTIICNTQSTIDAYVQTILAEMNYVFQLLDGSRVVTQIHFGGGSPHSISVAHLSQCITTIANKFTIAANTEIAIECNPADIDLHYIEQVTALGFNRISLGIQDFDEQVLKAVHRKVPSIPIGDFVQKIIECNARVNFDFIYGLPLQTPQQFKTTIQQAIALNPHRLVTFSYAHVPSVKSNQKNIDSDSLPTAHHKLQMLTNTLELMQHSGYTAIGLDHFAQQSDSLSIAKQQKTLHRNFQGYCTRETTGQVYAFGASGITQLADSYFQNSKDLQEYSYNIESQNISPQVGYVLTHEQKITATVIEYILCNESLHWNTISVQTGIEYHDLVNKFAQQIEACRGFETDGLIILSESGFTVTPIGKFFLRNIAAAFDTIFAVSTKTFSKTI